MAKVGLARGKSSYETVRKALDLLADSVHIPQDKPILVKPNLVSDTIELAVTPVDAVRATLDFLKDLGANNFIVGEATAGEHRAGNILIAPTWAVGLKVAACADQTQRHQRHRQQG